MVLLPLDLWGRPEDAKIKEPIFSRGAGIRRTVDLPLRGKEQIRPLSTAMDLGNRLFMLVLGLLCPWPGGHQVKEQQALQALLITRKLFSLYSLFWSSLAHPTLNSEV